MKCSASLTQSNGNSCIAPRQLLGSVGSATAAMHCLTAYGPWAVDVLQCSALVNRSVGSAMPAMQCPSDWGQWAAQLLQCAASLRGGNG